MKDTETILVQPAPSTENLVVQRLVFTEQPSEHNLAGTDCTSVWSENAKNGHALVVRGDNTHHASGIKIAVKPKTPTDAYI